MDDSNGFGWADDVRSGIESGTGESSGPQPGKSAQIEMRKRTEPLAKGLILPENFGVFEPPTH